jgi:hypothetical protein
VIAFRDAGECKDTAELIARAKGLIEYAAAEGAQIDLRPLRQELQRQLKLPCKPAPTAEQSQAPIGQMPATGTPAPSADAPPAAPAEGLSDYDKERIDRQQRGQDSIEG